MKGLVVMCYVKKIVANIEYFLFSIYLQEEEEKKVECSVVMFTNQKHMFIWSTMP